ncbi:XdhC family protein [Croceicoccus sediminis]|uniref:XdhC family protein n=1 Tax=Croceicoccus sediminis TaxID=2571150 RepID=UPI0014790531|nr:XdhC family protein [Croceicoccus sediminis]
METERSQIMDGDQAALRTAARGDAALCTVVGLDGSFSRRLGAQIAILQDGRCVGSLADGCLERELAAQANEARAQGKRRIVRYGEGSPVIDFRLPCGSGLDILIDPAPDRRTLREVVERLDAREPASLALPVNEGFLAERRYIPPLNLTLFGESLEAGELQRLSEAFGVSAAKLVPGKGLSLGQRPDASADAWTAVVLLFHDHEWEGPILDWALDTPAFYIGAIGGMNTREVRRAQLEDLGRDEREIAKVRSPVGLIPHTRDARTLALSILADVVAEYERLRPE